MSSQVSSISARRAYRSKFINKLVIDLPENQQETPQPVTFSTKNSPQFQRSPQSPGYSNQIKMNSPSSQQQSIFTFKNQLQQVQSVKNIARPPSNYSKPVQSPSSSLLRQNKSQKIIPQRRYSNKSQEQSRNSSNTPIKSQNYAPKTAQLLQKHQKENQAPQSHTPRVRTSANFGKASTPKHRSSTDQLKPSRISRPSSRRQQKQQQINQIVTQVKTQQTGESAYNEHLFQTFQAMKFIQNLPQADPQVIRSKMLYLPKRQGYENKKTVIFDLDETLVHCCGGPDQGEVPLTISFPSGEQIRAGINIRPFVKECLIAANSNFEVIVFTASHQCYADEVLNYLDPTGQLIHHRLYRDNCIIVDGVYIKDLRILYNRRLEDIVIVDNAAYSFSYQLDNGIPIISWSNDPDDKELFSLIDYLKILAKVEDIRAVNRQTFHLDTFYSDYLRDYISAQKGKENQPVNS